MPNFSVTDFQLVDSINYLNSGPITNGQESKGYWNYTGGYFNWPNVYPPYIQSSQAVAIALGPVPDQTYFRSPAYVFVNTTSTTDSVFVTSQLRPFLNYSVSAPTDEFIFQVIIYRYRVDDLIPGWYTSGEKLINFVEIASDNNKLDGTAPASIQAGTASIGETVFCSIVDNPGIGRWMYSQEFYYEIQTGTPVLNWVYGENIGITATVIKI